MAEQIAITEEGLKKLQDELERLKTVDRKQVLESIKVARSFGDLSENSEYDDAREEQRQIEAKIAKLEDQLKRVKVYSESEITTDRVSIGAHVKIHNVEQDKDVEYTLVGATEANPFEGKIADTSPVGSAILGAKVGDTVLVKLPGGERKMIILEINK